MKASLKTFLENRKEQDFINGRPYSKRKARKFLKEQPYKDYETLNGYDVHNMLLVLAYPEKEI